jgi:hypothetical protein
VQASSAFQEVFRRQSHVKGPQVLHKGSPARFLANVRHRTMKKISKSLILFMNLKMMGKIFRYFYIPEYAKQRSGQSSSQSYPQK